MQIKSFLIVLLIAANIPFSKAQTAYSLFWRSDSIQVKEIVSQQAVQYSFVGHHGPAIENSHCALRIYFNDSGAIDVYSKSGKQMELLKYLWYPTDEQREKEGAGADKYLVGRTLGLGGIALWDEEKEVRLEASRGRTARVGETRSGVFAEMIAYGVPYKGEEVDISIRIEMQNKNRVIQLTASELNGKKVQFLTGVNYPKEAIVEYGKRFISVWGTHPDDASREPVYIGGGMRFKPSHVVRIEQVPEMVKVVSKPLSKFATLLVAASSLEEELGNAEKFAAYVRR